MASAIDPTLGGALNVVGAGVPRDELKTALTVAASEITALQNSGGGGGGGSVIGPEFPDSTFRLLGSGLATKKLAFEVDTNVPPDTLRTLTAPAQDGTIRTYAFAEYDLADEDDDIPAGSIALIFGTATTDVAFTVQDGGAAGVETTIIMAGNPDGNTVSIDDASAGELITSAAQATTYGFVWTGAATILAESSVTQELGSLAFASTIAGTAVTLDDSAYSTITFEDLQEFIDDAQSLIEGSATPAPAIVTSNAIPFAVTSAMKAPFNTITTHQATVPFVIDKTVAAGTMFQFIPQHNGATIAIQDAAGTLNGTTKLINGKPAFAWVSVNAGSAPTITVWGGLVPDTEVSSTKTYAQGDYEKSFVLVSGAGDQTLPAAANVNDGWWVEILNVSGATRDIIGGDATEALANPGVLVVRKIDGALYIIGNGNADPVSVDAG